MVVRELVTILGFDIEEEKIKRLDALVDTAKVRVVQLQTQIEGVGKGIRRLGIGITAFVTAPFALASIGMIKAASDAEETESKFKTIFSSIEKEANEVAENLVKNYGLSRRASKGLLGDTGDLLAGFGFTQDMALDLSKQVNELAVDLASFTNFVGGTEGASRALTKALLGERESIKSLTIAILEKDVNEQVAIQRAKGITFQTERQAKAYATLTLAQKQSKNAIGDFSRTQTEFANKWRIFKSRIIDMAVSFGKLLLPLANLLVTVFTKIVEIIDRLPKGIKIVILSFAGLITVVGPLLIILGTIIGSFGFMILKFVLINELLALFRLSAAKIFFTIGAKILWLITNIGLLKRALVVIFKFLGVLAIKVGLVIGIIAAIGVAIGLLIEDILVWTQGGESAIGVLVGRFEEFKNKIVFFVNTIKSVFSSLWVALTTGNQKAWNDFKGHVLKVLELVGRGIDKLFDRLAEVGAKAAEILGKALLKVTVMLFKFGFNLVKMIGVIIFNLFKFIGAEIFTLLSKTITGIMSKIKSRFPLIAGALSKVGALVSGGADRPVGQTTRPLGARIPPENLGFLPSKTSVTENKLNLRTELTLQIPDATPESQRRLIEEQARGMVGDELNKAINAAITANPVTE